MSGPLSREEEVGRTQGEFPPPQWPPQRLALSSDTGSAGGGSATNEEYSQSFPGGLHGPSAGWGSEEAAGGLPLQQQGSNLAEFSNTTQDYRNETLPLHHPLIDGEASRNEDVEGSIVNHPSALFYRVKEWVRMYLLFGYFSPYMERSRDEGSWGVRASRLPSLWPSDAVDIWAERFVCEALKGLENNAEPERGEENLAEHQEASGSGCQEWRLLVVIIRVFGQSLGGIFAIKVFLALLGVLSVMCMAQFLRWQEVDPEIVTSAERTRGIACGFAILGLELFSIIIASQCSFWIDRVSLRIQSSLTAGLSRHALISNRCEKAYNKEGVELQKSSTYNLLVVDVGSITSFVFALMDIIMLPIRVCLSLPFLLKQVGWSAIVGMGVLVVSLFIMVLMEVASALLKTPYLKWRDYRLLRFHDVVSNLRGIRMLGWEKEALSSVKAPREMEVAYRAKKMYLDTFAAALSNGAFIFVKVAVFAAYVLSELKSDKGFMFKASKALPVVQLVSRFVGPFANLPFTINSLMEGRISMERYQRHVFGDHGSQLVSPKGTDDNEALCELGALKEYEGKPIIVRDCIFCWYANAASIKEIYENLRKSTQGDVITSKNFSEYDLRGDSGGPIEVSPLLVADYQSDQGSLVSDKKLANTRSSFDAKEKATHENLDRVFCVRVKQLDVSLGECAVIAGISGSGKTSFLHSLLGETTKLQGSYFVSRRSPRHTNKLFSAPCGNILGSVGFSAQASWIPEGDVRSVILFGRAYDSNRYNLVVKACELLVDFDSWGEEWDSRLILEGGLNLSGGQRARIALARAVYGFPESKSAAASDNYDKVFLLDDPFGSLDPSVAALIFYNLFGPGGLLRYAATILTVDQGTLGFFLERCVRRPLSVKLKAHVVRDGVVSFAADLSRYAASSDEPSAPMENFVGIGDKWVQKDVVLNDVGDFATVEERAFSGAVGKKTYLWYSKHAGLVMLALMAMLILCVEFTRFGSSIWLAHWTSLETPGLGSGSRFYRSAAMPLRFLQTTSNAYEEKEELNDNFYDIQMRDPVALQDKKFPVVENSVLNQRVIVAEGERSLKSDNEKKYSRFPSSLMFSSRWHTPSVVDGSGATQKTFELNKDANIRALTVFTTISLSNVAFLVILYCFGIYAALRALRSIHSSALRAVIKAPYWLYDCFPSGIILNRFSSDIEIIDGGPVLGMSYFYTSCIGVVITIAALSVLSPWCSPLIPIVGYVVYVYVYQLYRPTCRELQRSNLLALSPLCGHLSDAESGAVTIRAFGAQDYYRGRNNLLTTNLMKTQFIQCGSAQWATLRLQLLSYPFVFANTVIPILLRLAGLGSQLGRISAFLGGAASASSSAGFVGVAFSLALDLPNAIGAVMWSISYLEQKMCSVQRVEELVVEFSSQTFSSLSICENTDRGDHTDKSSLPLTQYERSLAKEALSPMREKKSAECAPFSTVKLVHGLSELPKHRTGIRIENLEVCYPSLVSRELPIVDTDNVKQKLSTGSCQPAVPTVVFEKPALRNIVAYAAPGEHIGIVGRTGSGKTTLLLALLNLLPVTRGRICLDGIPFDRIDPCVLRKNLVGILPQFPPVLKGWSVRKFLDPDNTFLPGALYRVIAAVGLTNVVKQLPHGLDTLMASDDGATTAPYWSNGSPCDQREGSVGASPTPGGFLKFSESQIRLLSVARLALRAHSYRLVLVDEPPPRQLSKKHASFLMGGEFDDISGSGGWSQWDALSNGTSKDYMGCSEIEAASSSATAMEDIGGPQVNVGNVGFPTSARCKDSEVDIAAVLQRLFPKATVFVVAHHASTFRFCKSLWVFCRGELRGVEKTDGVRSQEELTAIINKYDDKNGTLPHP